MLRSLLKQISVLSVCCALILGVLVGCKPASTSSYDDADNSKSIALNESKGDPSDETSLPEDGVSEGEQSKSGDVTSKVGPGNDTSKKPPAPPPIKVDFKGRVFKYAANWTEPVDDNNYVKKKDFIQKTYNCKIEHIPLLDADARTNLINSINAGAPIVDWFTQGPGVYNYAKNGMLYPISDIKTIDINDPKWNKLIKDYSTINGKTYGIYWKQNVFRNVLLYNKSLIKGEDDLYTLQKNNKLTWNKLFDIAKRVWAKGTPGISATMDLNDFTNLFIAANGGKLATRGKGFDFTYTYDSKNTRNALNIIQDWYKSGVILDVGGKSYLYAHSEFYKGRLGMICCDNWQMSDIFKKSKFKVGAVLFPAGPDANLPLVEQNLQEFYMVPSSVQKPDEIGYLINIYADYDIKNEPSWQEIWGDMVDDDEILDTLKKYTNAIEKKQYFMDYRDILMGAIYDNGVYAMLVEVARSRLTPQAYLESIGPVCKAAIAEFNK